MIDWHSHVLPRMDDGSKSVEETLELLSMLSNQGVTTVVATPHFYANDESVSSFLKRRSESYASLCDSLGDSMPKILLGAEVSYYSGVSRLEGLSSLCIEGTRLLLLEMPFAKWTEHTVREIKELAAQGQVTVVLAHIERYIDMQDKSIFEELSSYGVLMQVNASFFDYRATKRKALKMLSRGEIQVIGSDAHGIKTRPPILDKAYEAIQKKLGGDILADMDGYGKYLLGITE